MGKVPWGWVAVSCYGSALVFAFLSQWQGLEWTESYLYRYQTLIAGVATFVALLIAIEQLRHDRERAVVGAVLRYEAEFDALSEIHEEMTVWRNSARDAGIVAALLGHRSGHVAVGLNKGKWERLRSATHVSLEAHIAQLMYIARTYNDTVASVNARHGPLTKLETNMLAQGKDLLLSSIDTLVEAVDRRYENINSLIETTTNPRKHERRKGPRG